MTTATLPRLTLLRVRPLALLIALSCLIAAVVPYDALFAKVTLGQPLLRAGAMLGCWLGGLWLLRANGFTLGVTSLRRPFLAIAGWAAAVALSCLLLDQFIFRAILPEAYLAFQHEPLPLRLAYAATRTVNEHVLYRLCVGGAFVWALRRLWPDPRWTLALGMTGMMLAQLINVYANVGTWGSSPTEQLWLLSRFVLPGFAWAWLTIRHGFAANEGAAIGVHLILQPLVSLAWH